MVHLGVMMFYQQCGNVMVLGRIKGCFSSTGITACFIQPPTRSMSALSTNGLRLIKELLSGGIGLLSRALLIFL